MDLARLAEVAAFSAFHFHRIFLSQVGETVGNYITRRRVEQAAARLLSQPRLSVLSVSLAVGFGSPEAFTRAFKKRFGCAPSHWKNESKSSAEIKNSKLSQAKSSPSQAKAERKVYTRRMSTTTSPIQVKVITRPPVRIAYLRYQGPFGPAVGRFWAEKVAPWMEANNLFGAPRYGVSQDDPQITPPTKCRYDAGVEVTKDFVPTQNAQIGMVAPGLYASAKFKGRSADMPAMWDRVLREWLPASGYQLDARPCFEYYPVDAEFDEKTGVFSCDLCMPIAKL